LVSALWLDTAPTNPAIRMMTGNNFLSICMPISSCH
jgi:hypothetical protein